MKLKQIGSNQTELQFSCGSRVLVSYETPVAAYLPEIGYVRTDTKFSSTTSRHINKWLEGVNAREVPQHEIEQLCERA